MMQCTTEKNEDLFFLSWLKWLSFSSCTSMNMLYFPLFLNKKNQPQAFCSLTFKLILLN